MPPNVHAGRRALLIHEMSIVLCGLCALGLIVAGVVHERRAARRVEEAAAALETAQNLLAAARQGTEAAAPAGWSVERNRLSPAVEVVKVRGHGVTLATVLPPPSSAGATR